MRDSRVRLRWEIVLVLAVAIAPSTLAAVFQLIELALAPTPIAETTTQLNPTVSPTPLLDAAIRSSTLLLRLAPVALVVWLLWDRHRTGFARLGLDFTRPGRDLAGGIVLAAAIGLPGLALYATSRILGFSPQLIGGSATDALGAALLILAAVRTALLEEVVVVGYLALRLPALGWRVPAVIAVSALVRGSYHLYQGVPMAIGNVVMGLVFAAWYWTRSRPRSADGRVAPRRVMPLVIAHVLLDVVAFLGAPLATALWPGVF